VFVTSCLTKGFEGKISELRFWEVFSGGGGHKEHKANQCVEDCISLFLSCLSGCFIFEATEWTSIKFGINMFCKFSLKLIFCSYWFAVHIYLYVIFITRKQYVVQKEKVHGHKIYISLRSLSLFETFFDVLSI